MINLEEQLKLYNDGQVRVIAIDGRSGAGKTTLANRLAESLGAGVIHMDDFFLPEHLRTDQRLSQPGGNVHYERFKEEVLPYLNHKEAFSYVPFNCKTMDYGKPCLVKASPWRIVEGAYSCHPYFGDYMDIRVFCHIEPEEQDKRILLRNGAEGLKAFKSRWIPMEENYLKTYEIQRKADFIFE